MNGLLRGTGRGIFALLFVITLIVQSVLPVYADTADTSIEAAEETASVSEEGTSQSLGYFNRIAVNSVSGILTIRSGEEFGISFPEGWEQTHGFSVQDEILVVSGRKSSTESEKSGDGSAVVLGEDEPTEDGSAPEPETAKEEPPQETAQEAVTEGTTETVAVVPALEITIPAGVGLDTLRIAMESGDLILEDVTASSVTIQSGGGNLVLRDVSLGTVDIYTEVGKVEMAESTFGSLNIGMGEGAVSVHSEDALSGCRMELKTGDGAITYNGTEEGAQYMQPGNGNRSLMIQVGGGNILIEG